MSRSAAGMGRNRYPTAVIAAYGPDNTFATKLVVSVLGKRDEELAMRKWTTVAIDVRHDPTIAADVAEFLEAHGVREQLSYDRIVGCPHEEGIDYPMGRTCPRCPFWAGIDRFTHEPLVQPAPTMTPAEVLAELSREHIAQPREALLSADGHRAQLVEPLRRALERGVADPEGLPEPEAQLFAYALYLLAKWREPRAYPLVCRFLSLPGQQPYDLGGDIATQDGARILAAVCDGNLDPIKSVILNREADEFCRSTAIHALSLLAAWAEVPRESIEAWFLWLATEGLEREPSDAWDGLCSECVDIEALPVFPALRRAYDDGLASDMSMDPTEMDQVEREPRGLRLADTQDRYPPIDDVAEAISWWASFAAASARIGRNEPCPCGSGKKYKKCHGA